MKKEIEINTRGRIIHGAYEGWYVFVEDDIANTGGYYIFIADRSDVKGNPDVDDGGTGYDSWVENQEQVRQYFENSNWVIEWE